MQVHAAVLRDAREPFTILPRRLPEAGLRELRVQPLEVPPSSQVRRRS